MEEDPSKKVFHTFMNSNAAHLFIKPLNFCLQQMFFTQTHLFTITNTFTLLPRKMPAHVFLHILNLFVNCEHNC